MFKTNNFDFNPDKSKYTPIHFNSVEKYFSAFGSDLGWEFDIKTNIILTNIVTKNTITFTLKTIKKDDEGEIQVWIFKSIFGAKFPCELHIIND